MGLRSRTGFVLLLAAVVIAASSPRADESRQRAEPTVPALDAVESSVLLIGDAGGAATEGDPVLLNLAREVARRPERTMVVYLGDNVYPDGLPSKGASGRAQAEQRFQAEITAARAARRLIFIPGNHDWDAAPGAGGWDGVRRQAAFLAAQGVGVMQPPAGCPGPSVEDVGLHLRLVFVDTEWWLRGQPVPDVVCRPTTAAEVTAGVATVLREAGARRVVVVAHHPPMSAGPHGGHFGWRDHVFPLRAVQPGLWVPLPIFGSIYPLARRAGVSPQDLAHGRYQTMVEALTHAYAERPPLLIASGHEHQLGLFRGTSVGSRYVAVSGSGNVDHQDAPRAVQDALFTSGLPGVMRLDVGRDGRVRLAVLTLADAERLAEVFSIWLE